MTNPTIRTSTYKWFVDKHGHHYNEAYIVDAGNLHYDPNTAELRMGDGITLGGLPIGGSLEDIDLSLFYTKGETDQLFTNIIGDATANGNTLGKLENRIQNNYAYYNNVLNQFNNLPDTDDQLIALDVTNKDLSITNGNSVKIEFLPKPVEYLHMKFSLNHYYAQSSGTWNIMPNPWRALPRGYSIVSDTGLYKVNGFTAITLDPNRTYKMILKTDYWRVIDQNSSGKSFNNNNLLHTFLKFGFIHPYTNYSNGNWSFVTLRNAYARSPLHPQGMGTPTLEMTFNLNESFYRNYNFDSFNFAVNVSGDATFYWAGELIIYSLDNE